MRIDDGGQGRKMAAGMLYTATQRPQYAYMLGIQCREGKEKVEEK